MQRRSSEEVWGCLEGFSQEGSEEDFGALWLCCSAVSVMFWCAKLFGEWQQV